MFIINCNYKLIKFIFWALLALSFLWKLEKQTADMKINSDHIVKTYDDHRMAMSLAPLAIKTNRLVIEDPDVVKKSYLGFWTDLKSIGFKIDKK